MSRRKVFHQPWCGSDRAQFSSESKSRQYWRMPTWGGNQPQTIVSWSSSPSGFASTAFEIDGPSLSAVHRPLTEFDALPEVDDDQVGIGGEIDRATLGLGHRPTVRDIGCRTVPVEIFYCPV